MEAPDAGPNAGPLEAGDAQGAAEEVQQEEQPQLLSKNQQKKLRKQQRYEEQKRLRREQEKQAKQAKQEQRRAEAAERLAVMSEEERAAWREDKRVRLQARKEAGKGKKAKLLQALEGGQRVVIDLDFEDKMSDAEIKSLCQQLGYAYGENSRAATPCHLILTSLRGSMRERMRRQVSGIDNWVVTATEEDYLQHFAEREGELVYLTADSPNELQELDPSKAYIIGGLVDRNRHKGLCLRKAEEQGIATGKLPIGGFMQLASSQVMTTNHVVSIILRWLELRDWEAAFNAVVPPRKRKAADGEEEEEQQEGEEEQQEGQRLRLEPGHSSREEGRQPAGTAAAAAGGQEEPPSEGGATAEAAACGS